jgi:hypothetical protein
MNYTATITKYVLAATLLLALFAIAGCGDTGPGATVESFLEAALDEDCAAMLDLSSEESIGDQTREEAIQECEDSGTLTAVFDNFDDIELEGFETLEEEIDRDEATVKARITMKIGDREETFEETFLLLQEGEDWKIRL